MYASSVTPPANAAQISISGITSNTFYVSFGVALAANTWYTLYLAGPTASTTN